MKAEPQLFARTFGRAICRRSGVALLRSDLQAVVEVFGPPETLHSTVSTTTLFWNFQRQDGTGGFSVWVDVPSDRLAKNRTSAFDLEVAAKSDRESGSFFEWVMDRLEAVGNGNEPPSFVGDRGFVVVRAA
jgi:hypothetical protein